MHLIMFPNRWQLVYPFSLRYHTSVLTDVKTKPLGELQRAYSCTQFRFSHNHNPKKGLCAAMGALWRHVPVTAHPVLENTNGGQRSFESTSFFASKTALDFIATSCDNYIFFFLNNIIYTAIKEITQEKEGKCCSDSPCQ